MVSCAACGQTILFGGKRQGDLRFCGKKCLAKGAPPSDRVFVPESLVGPRVWQIWTGRCPECHGPGPIDVHQSYRVWSGLFMTSYTTRINICCTACGTRARWKDTAFSVLFGWWAIPWGPIWTVIQITRNLAALLRAELPTTPSALLSEVVRFQLSVEHSAPASAQLAPPR
jgi:hypothetical protein